MAMQQNFTITDIVPYTLTTIDTFRRPVTLPNITNHVIYSQFYKDYNIKDPLDLKKKFLDADWLTQKLVDAIIDSVPSSHDISSDPKDLIVSNINAVFQIKCTNAFPIDRQFVNYKQLEQYVTLFLKSWNIMKHCDGNCFKCFYSQIITKKKISYVSY